jgi:hypothetical protein
MKTRSTFPASPAEPEASQELALLVERTERLYNVGGEIAHMSLLDRKMPPSELPPVVRGEHVERHTVSSRLL